MKLSVHRKTRAQGMVEYMLIVGLIALLVFVAVKALGSKVKTGFDSASKAVESATSDWSK